MREKKIFALLLAVLALGLVGAGCGGDDDESVDETPAAESSDSGSDAGSADPGDIDIPGSVEEAVEDCVEGVENSGLSGDAKDQALGLCEQAAEAAESITEDLPADLDEAAKNCRDQAEQVLQGDALDQALAQCDAIENAGSE